MASHVYRYQLVDPTVGALAVQVPGSPVVDGLSPPIFIDITVDSADLADLSDTMTTRGYSYYSTDPTTTTAQQANSVAGAASPTTGVDREIRVSSALANVVSISGLLTIDGVTVAAGDRVLLKDQSTGSQNGIYVAASGAWSYASDWMTGAVVPEMVLRVSEGTVNAHTKWRLTNQGTITVGTTATTFTNDAPSSTDVNAIHKNVAAEISTVAGKSTPVSADLLLIEDSANSNTKASLQVGNLANSSTGITSDSRHQALLQLIHFIDEGPANGFTTGATKATTGTVFPTKNLWKRADATNLVEQDITWTGVMPTTIVWKIYDTDGSTVLGTVTDTITYSGVFESSRSRAIA